MNKYLLLVVIMISGFCANVWADVLTIGASTYTSREPLGNYANYAYCAELLTNAELGNQNMSITSVAWHPTVNNPNSSPYRIYLKETSLSALPADTWANMISGATLLYDSSILVTGSSDANVWFTFNLTSAFLHTNSNNLMILVESNPGVAGTNSSAPSCWYSSTSNYATEQWSSTTTPPVGNGTTTLNRPNLRLTYTLSSPSTPLPATYTTPANAATSITLTQTLNWTAPLVGQAPTGYKLYFGTDPAATNIANGYNIGNILTFSPPLLNGNTYYWKIVPYNGAGDATNCPVWSFSTVLGVVTLLTPASGSTNIPNGTPLTWSAVNGATSYQVYFGTSSPGSLVATVTALTYTPNITVSNTTCYWKIVPKMGTVVGPNSTIFNFVSGLLPATIGTPANGATTTLVTAPLTWYAPTGATSYDVYFGTTLPAIANTNVATTTWTPPVMDPLTTYYWMIVPRNAAGTAVNCPTWSFTTTVAPPGVSANPIPSIGSIDVVSNPVMGWDAVSGATSYDIYLGTTLPTTVTANVTTNSYTPATLSPSSTYSWKVVPKGAGGGAVGAPVWTFTTGAAPGTPTTPYPGHMNTFVPVNAVMTWSAVAGATSYDVYVYGSSIYSATVNTNSFTPPTPFVYSGTYYWRVTAINSFGPGIPNGTWWFQTALGPATAPVPADGATGVFNYATLSWTGGGLAYSYDVYFGTTLPTTVTINTSGYSWKPPTMSLGTTYVWKIVPRYNSYTAADPAICPVWSFTTSAIAPPALSANPVPGNASTGNVLNPTLGWDAVAAATSYDVYFGTNLPTTVTVNVLTPGWTPPGPLLPGTIYRWKVVPKGAGGDAQSPVTWTFTTGTVPAAATTPSPATGATGVSLNPTLGWANVATATSYDVYFGSPLPSTVTATVTTNSWAPPTTLNIGTVYQWKVIGRNTFGPAAAGSTWSFTTINVPGIASLASPANGATTTLITASLNWYAVSGATSYDVYFGTTLPAIANATVTTTTWLPPVMDPQTTYYWQIVPRNAVGPAINCPIWSFTTNVAPPLASANPYPTDTATGVISNPVLSWDLVAGATSYDVYIGTTMPTTVTANVLTNTYTPAVLSPSSTYSWKIVPKNAGGGAVTVPVWTFTTGAAPGTPTTPYPGHMNTFVPINAVMTWSAVAGATSYDVYVYGSGIYTATVYTNSYTPPTPFVYSGTYYWRVTAMNAFGPGIANGTWWFQTALGPATVPVPSDGATGVFIYQPLSWTGGGLAYSYDVYFGTTLPTTLTANTSGYSWTPPTMTVNTTYQWKIVPRYNTYTAADPAICPTWSFTTAALAPPALATTPSPATASTGVMTNVTLGWSAVTNATNYDVYFGTTMPSTVTANVTTNSWTPSFTLNPSTAYSWKVVPKGIGGTAQGTPATWTFTTGAAPTITTNPYPAQLALNVPTSIVLTWNTIAAATSYDVYFGTTLPASPNANVVTNSWTPPTLDAGTAYLWKVVPRNAFGPAVGSQLWVFTTIVPLPLAAINPEPTDGAVSVAIDASLLWDAVTGADSYDVYFGTTLPGTPNANVLTPGWTPPVMLNNTLYSWMIVPKNAAGDALNCPTWTFTTIVALPLAATNPVPSDGAVNVAIDASLLWDAVTDATSYDVYFGTTLPGTPDANVLTPGWTPPAMLNNTLYSWMIVPKNAAGDALNCPTWTFTTIVALPLAASNPVPADTATGIAINASLGWDAVIGADSYDVYFGTTLPGTPNANVLTPGWTPPVMLNNTLYSWMIVPKNAAGDALNCPTWTFTTIVALPLAATNPVPADTATGVAINASLSWDAVTGATSYDVYFGTTLPGTPDANVLTPGWTPPAMLNNTLYSWMIVPKNAAGDALNCPVWTFTTIVALTAPANMQLTNNGTDLVITWDAVIGADAYTVYSSTDPYALPIDWITEGVVLTPTFTDPSPTAIHKFYKITAITYVK